MQSGSKNIHPDFLIIPYGLIRDPSLEPNDRLVYAVVYWFEHLKDGKCFASNSLIAKLLSITPRSVQNSLTQLEKKKYIERIYKDSSNRHRIEIRTKIAFKLVRTVGDIKIQNELEAVLERTGGDSQSEPVVTRDRIRNKNREQEKNMSAKADAFTQFWIQYPKKELKKKTLEIWKRKRLSPYLNEILKFLASAKNTDRWKKGYVPQPPTFLNGERWNDDLEAYQDNFKDDIKSVNYSK